MSSSVGSRERFFGSKYKLDSNKTLKPSIRPFQGWSLKPSDVLSSECGARPAGTLVCRGSAMIEPGHAHSPSNLDIIVCRLRHQELPWDFHFSSLRREIAQKPTLFFYEEEFGKLLGFGLQNFDPLFQFRNEVVKLHGSWNTEVKIFKIKHE